MQKFFLIFFLCWFHNNVTAQTPVTVGDCTITYSITGGDATTNKNLAGATKSLYIKGKLSRVDLVSNNYNQHIIYDNKTGIAIVLKQVGSEKYKSTFTPELWKKENKRFEGIKFTTSSETKTILGYECKKLIGTLTDGSTYNMYYAIAIIPSATENPYQFKDIPGFVLEYETTSGSGSAKITYSATMINFNPVPASKFEIPASGYRILQ